jgi:Fe-S-cluster-containing hydrogenase component 2
LQVIKVDPKKCTGCHQCELWCGTEIASVAKELAGAIQEEPQPVPRVSAMPGCMPQRYHAAGCGNGAGIRSRTDMYCVLDVCDGLPLRDHQPLANL